MKFFLFDDNNELSYFYYMYSDKLVKFKFIGF